MNQTLPARILQDLKSNAFVLFLSFMTAGAMVVHLVNIFEKNDLWMGISSGHIPLVVAIISVITAFLCFWKNTKMWFVTGLNHALIFIIYVVMWKINLG